MNKLLKPEEVAELLGVRLSTIYQWTHLGFIPHAKLGRFVRFDIDEIEKWVKKRSTNGRTSRAFDISRLGL
jgi:excisionase family DNA binding protein